MKTVLQDLASRKESRIALGLERVFAVLRGLGNPQERLRIIHVAGTNGKGSVCRMLHGAFCAAGYPAGAYYSPHLQTPLERIQNCRGFISRAEFESAYQRVLAVEGQEKLTYFEILTATALQYFRHIQADPVILETGMGGRLDATNTASHPLLTIITSIGYDHKQWLGNTLAAIAREKGGIFKPGVPALVGPVPLEAKRALMQCAREKGVKDIHFIARGLRPVHIDWKKGIQTFRWKGQSIHLPMLGHCQGINLRIILEALEVCHSDFSIKSFLLKIKERNRDEGEAGTGIRMTKIPGRWDLRWIKGKPWVFDVAHNPDAVENFLRTLQISPWAKQRPKAALIGFLKDKDYHAMAAKLIPYFDSFIAATLEGERGVDARDIIHAFPPRYRRKVSAAASPLIGFRTLLHQRHALTAVLGSFRIVGPVFSAL